MSKQKILSKKAPQKKKCLQMWSVPIVLRRNVPLNDALFVNFFPSKKKKKVKFFPEEKKIPVVHLGYLECQQLLTFQMSQMKWNFFFTYFCQIYFLLIFNHFSRLLFHQLGKILIFILFAEKKNR